MTPSRNSVQEMFDTIAGKYDFLNHFLSFGIDRLWRIQLRNALKLHFQGAASGISIVDVASGTGDVALTLCKVDPASIVATDISDGMMDVGRKKVAKRKKDHIISFLTAAAEDMPFSNDRFDAATVAFGVRNFENLQKGLSEMVRVVRPGGIILILEFSQPSGSPFRELYRFYSNTVIPFFGKLISRHQEAYTYLPETAAVFPSGEKFLEILREAGGRECSQKPLTGGIATLYKAVK